MTFFDPVYRALADIGYLEPLHPPFTHFPIALVTASLFFGLWALLWRRPGFWVTARHCLVLAWLFIFPAVLFGFMDWQHYYQGAWLLPIIIKIGLASFLFVLLSIGLILVKTGREESKGLLAIYIIAFLTVGGLGYYGGRLVFEGRAVAVPASLEAGKRLFENNCMACHPNLGNAIMPDMPIIGSDNLKDLHTFVSLVRDPRLDNGQKGPMPDFTPQKISDEQARQLYEYLVGVLKGAVHHEH